jgi:hypothetical protein
MPHTLHTYHTDIPSKEVVQKEMKHLVFDKPFKRVCGFQRNSEAE